MRGRRSDTTQEIKSESKDIPENTIPTDSDSKLRWEKSDLLSDGD